MVDGVANGRVDVLERLERGLRIDDARARGEIDVDQTIASENGARGGIAVEGDDTGVIHGARSLGRPLIWESKTVSAGVFAEISADPTHATLLNRRVRRRLGSPR